MLTLLLGTDWVANRQAILDRIARDVQDKKNGRILIVPELISHDTERRLCQTAGDTASCFAEVLTFSRLAKRVSDAAGFGAPECLDNGGRIVAMASAARQLHSQLKAYAAVETRPEFLSGLLDAVDEFKRCCISSADLLAASKRTEGSFAQKLEELSLLLDAYDSLCARGKRDPRDQMTWLLEQLESSDFAENHVFYMDGFPDLTRQHNAIIEYLIVHSQQVVVSFTCDQIGSDTPGFEKAGETAAQLLRYATEAGIAYEIVENPSNNKATRAILPALFRGSINEKCDVLNTYHAETISDECHGVAEQILELVRNGCRYRDIGVACTDMSAYQNMLQMILARYQIPVYLSGTEDILDKTVITTVLSAIDAAVGAFEQSDVLRYLRSTLSPLDMEMCDRIENYAIVWNITGNRWERPWENHPQGLGTNWSEIDRVALAELNQARSLALTPLFRLAKQMKDAVSLQQLVEAVYAFFQDVRLDERLETLAARIAQGGDLRNGQILSQLWEILLTALEQLSDMLGQTHWDAETFTRLLKLLLSQYDVGTIPAVLDAVVVGPITAMRCQQTKHLFVLGASEGSFPAYTGSVGVLTDLERTQLRQLGVPLTGGAMEGLQAEFADIYGVFCGANESVTVSYSGGQPSFLYRRLCDISGSDNALEPLGISLTSPLETAAFLARTRDEEQANVLDVAMEYEEILARNGRTLGDLSQNSITRLYGTNLKLSASQVDKLADCRLAYFLKYGLRLQERKQATVDPAEFGTYVHAVLEQTGRKVKELGGFHNVTLAQTLEIADKYSQDYIAERFGQIDSQRISYLFHRNTQELQMVVTELWDELKDSAFEPIDFELAFGIDGGLDPVAISGRTMQATLRGFVDRVDAWKQAGKTYYRIVDYKTGKKDFDYCDIYNGLGLQMLLYLFTLEQNGVAYLGDAPVTAGVQYFPARVPVVSVDGRADTLEALQAREKLWKRKGLLLADEAVLDAMEPGENPKRLSYTRKKDGTISGDLADRNQMELLKGYVFALLGKMVDDISSGNIEANPYTRGSRHNACSFCPYGAICHDTNVAGRRNYAAMTAQKFWEEIEKEMSSHG